MKKIIVLSIICLALISCNDLSEMVSFKEPQPANKKSLSAFPGKLKGKYISQDQASVLSIYDNYIIEITDYEFGTKRSDLDSSYSISGDTLIDNYSGYKEKITSKGDSIFAHVHDEDTISNLTTGDILKKFKGHYFLNKGNNKDGWHVTQLTLIKGNLITAYISDSTAFSKLIELAEKPLDTVTKQFVIDKRKFKALVKSGGFSDHDTFTKVR